MAVDTVGPKDDTADLQLPVSTYQVVEAKPVASDARFVAAELDGDYRANASSK